MRTSPHLAVDDHVREAWMLVPDSWPSELFATSQAWASAIAQGMGGEDGWEPPVIESVAASLRQVADGHPGTDIRMVTVGDAETGRPTVAHVVLDILTAQPGTSLYDFAVDDGTALYPPSIRPTRAQHLGDGLRIIRFTELDVPDARQGRPVVEHVRLAFRAARWDVTLTASHTPDVIEALLPELELLADGIDVT